MIVETHAVGKTSININGYKEKIIRNRNSKGGGILIAKRDEAKINMIAVKIHETYEQVWVKINNSIFAVVYAPIESRTEPAEIEEWYYELEKDYSIWQEEQVIIVGDLNSHIGNDHLGIQGNHKNISKSGEILRSLVERRNLTIMNNTNICSGKWTREDPSGSKSIIDMILTNNQASPNIQKIQIDEEHNYKLSRVKRSKSNKTVIKSDHNTILIEINKNSEQIPNQKSKIWNIKSTEAWEKYKRDTENIEMKEKWKNDENINLKYSKWSRQIKSLMYKHIDRLTLKNNNIRSTKVKTINKRRKEIGKEIGRLRKNGKLKGIVCKILLDKQLELKENIIEEIHKENLQTTERRLRNLSTKSSISNEIWKIRQRNYDKTGNKLAVKSKQGDTLTSTTQIKERYIEYYKELLKGREEKEDYKLFNSKINQNFSIYSQLLCYDKEPINSDFTLKELETAIKNMKKAKSPGPDEIYNEVVINAGKNLKLNILDMLNTFWKEEQIPDELYKLNIKSLYKGKGDANNLENQRGIFLGNIIVKLYEKLIILRAESKIENGMSCFQAGGRKDYSTSEPVFVLRSIIEKYKYFGEELLVEFLDLRKAFDKMILRNIMQNLWNIGIRGKIWRNIYNINKNATIKIKTAIGQTNEFTVGETLKQGSVLATNLAALHTDTVSNRFTHTGLGANYGNEIVPLLLYQDDIVKFDKNRTNMQKSNIILEIFQDENRMQYHNTKSVMMTNCKEIQNQILLNNEPVPVVQEYKYLGDVVTMNNSLLSLISERKNVISGTIAEIVSITAETHKFSMISSNQYLNGIIAPKLLLNSETWHPISETEHKNLEQIYSQSLKRLLHLPYSTPTKGLYHELGIMSVRNQITVRKLNFLHKIINKPDATLAKRIIYEQMNLPYQTWIKNAEHHLNKINNQLKTEDLKKYSKSQWKNEVKKYSWQIENEEFQAWCTDSKKCNHMKNSPIKMQNYIQCLPPKNAKVILETRLGLIDVKTNYHNKHIDEICRNCQTNKETMFHFIDCLTSTEKKGIMDKFQAIWDLDNIETLKEISDHIYNILKDNPFFDYTDI